MSQPTYAIWVLDKDYNKVQIINHWLKMTFWQKLNDIAPLEELYLTPDNSFIPAVRFGTRTRIQIYRDGSLVWGGTIEGERWHNPKTSPIGSTYYCYGLDYAAYAKWRVVVPASGYDYDECEDSADDVAKHYVRAHLGANAELARRFTDLTVDGDSGRCGSVSKAYAYDSVLDVLKDLARENSFYWRFVPTSAGCTFKTMYPLWGEDRTKGTEKETVISYDRRNILDADYATETTQLSNYIYVLGPGQGLTRVTSTASSSDVSTYGRRETSYSAPNTGDEEYLTDEGNYQLAQKRVVANLTMTHKPLMWRRDYNLGDKISIRLRQFRDFEWDAVVTAVRVTVDQNGVETVEPQLE